MKFLIYHHNDADGKCAATIMGWYARTLNIIPKYISVDYKDKLSVDEVDSETIVAIVDFSFPSDIMYKVMDTAARTIWCDHHISASKYDYAQDPNLNIEGYRDFSNKGFAGCECTWQFCNQTVPMPYSLILLGDYDAWRLAYKPECFQFYEGLKMRNTEPEAEIWSMLFNPVLGPTTIGQLIAEGTAAIRYRDNYCSHMVETYGYSTKLDGIEAFALNTTGFGSQAFGDKMQDFPLCIAYTFDGFNYSFSLYSEKEIIDVSVIAQKFGGGGHKGAAGFTSSELPFKRNIPYPF
jgi:oligoribonuclease NrnB/cAMP/cGMP phosphodiesterase (DHH superfamily)